MSTHGIGHCNASSVEHGVWIGPGFGRPFLSERSRMQVAGTTQSDHADALVSR